MLAVSRRSIALALIVGVFTARHVTAAEGAAGRLVDVNWLDAHRADADVLILDASPTQMYSAKHIPGAVGVDLMSWYGVLGTPLSQYERTYQSWGISPNKRIVMYDQGGSFLATRLFFSLYHHGFPLENLFLLDGGLFKWEERGLPVTSEKPPESRKGSFTITAVRDDAEAELPEVVTASGDPTANVLVEALGGDWHFGEVLAFNRSGHIPNGVLLPSADFFNPDRTFKSAADITRMLDYLGIRREQQIYTYCGGGVAASAPYFALKFVLNYPKVKLYTGSEMGWLQDPRELPYWTYDAPFLMRHTTWLQSWGGQRMRAYLGARVSIVDVRPPDAFTLGHVPFALNIPADAFRRDIRNPEKLAALLGTSGVDVSHEAVVVSGGGLTPESALAFVMLEMLGQKKVSVFMDSMATWTQLGFALKTDPTVVGPRTSLRDVSIPSTSYPSQVRKDVVIADANATKGFYPKVFIASGKSVPGRVPEGNVVHVPYADLLSADGKPKAASEIWKILVKAGVPRYAELVCFSDDPGEAAVNYFVLKLMGYPDAKVLVL